jgi:AbrB family looped-hinge helix DNA binding protein
LSKVRVKHKGQVTIPIEIRSKLGIEEGAILDIQTQNDTIILKPAPKLEGGEVVGEEEQKRLLQELERLRSNWR